MQSQRNSNLSLIIDAAASMALGKGRLIVPINTCHSRGLCQVAGLVSFPSRGVDGMGLGHRLGAAGFLVFGGIVIFGGSALLGATQAAFRQGPSSSRRAVDTWGVGFPDSRLCSASDVILHWACLQPWPQLPRAANGVYTCLSVPMRISGGQVQQIAVSTLRG